MHEAVIDLKALMALSAEVFPGLSSYLSLVIPWIEKAPKVIVEDPVAMLAGFEKTFPADPGVCFKENSGRTAMPFPSMWLELSDQDGHAKGLLFRSIAPSLIHALILIRTPEPVALERYTGTRDPVGRWIPTDCEYLLSLKGSVCDRAESVRKIYGCSEKIGSLITAFGSSGIIPLPAHDGVDNDSLVDSLEAYRQTLREAYLVLCAMSNSAYRLEELGQGHGAAVYTLRPAPASEPEHPEAARMVMETIKNLPGCTLCGGSPIVGGGILTRAGRTAGDIYALCNVCINQPDHIRLIDRAFNERTKQLPTVEGPGTLQ
jgi:hypothetical protein